MPSFKRVGEKPMRSKSEAVAYFDSWGDLKIKGPEGKYFSLLGYDNSRHPIVEGRGFYPEHQPYENLFFPGDKIEITF